MNTAKWTHAVLRTQKVSEKQNVPSSLHSMGNPTTIALRTSLLQLSLMKTAWISGRRWMWPIRKCKGQYWHWVKLVHTRIVICSNNINEIVLLSESSEVLTSCYRTSPGKHGWCGTTQNIVTGEVSAPNKQVMLFVNVSSLTYTFRTQLLKNPVVGVCAATRATMRKGDTWQEKHE